MFQPLIPLTGYAGWKVFDKSAPRQRAVFSEQPSIKRELDYFRANIGKIRSSTDLVSDRRLLATALGAFGLEDEISKKALIRRVIDDGVADPRAFVNRLNDTRWRDFAAAFSAENLAFGRYEISMFREAITDRFAERSFERAVGETDQDFRIAMNFRREIKSVAAGANADRIGWFQIMGQRPLRAVVEAALSLSPSIANLDIDKQREIFERKSEALFGTRSPTVFKDEANVEIALQRFFARAEAAAGTNAQTRGGAALMMMNASPLESSAQIGLIISNATLA